MSRNHVPTFDDYVALESRERSRHQRRSDEELDLIPSDDELIVRVPVHGHSGYYRPVSLRKEQL